MLLKRNFFDNIRSSYIIHLIRLNSNLSREGFQICRLTIMYQVGRICHSIHQDFRIQKVHKIQANFDIPDHSHFSRFTFLHSVYCKSTLDLLFSL